MKLFVQNALDSQAMTPEGPLSVPRGERFYRSTPGCCASGQPSWRREAWTSHVAQRSARSSGTSACGRRRVRLGRGTWMWLGSD